MKYELTENYVEQQVYRDGRYVNVKLYQIRALAEFASVEKDELGGFIERVENLAQGGDAWVSGNARVSGNAQVYGSAQVSGNARVSGNAQVYGSARVYGDAWVYGNAQVSGNAWVYGNAQVSGDARVCGNAQVSGNAWVCGDAQVSGNAWVSGNARVYGDARVCGNAWVYGNADIFWISKIGSCLRTTTVYKIKDGGLEIVCGCFCGSLEQFALKVEETHGDSKHGKEYKLLIELVKVHFEVEEVAK